MMVNNLTPIEWGKTLTENKDVLSKLHYAVIVFSTQLVIFPVYTWLRKGTCDHINFIWSEHTADDWVVSIYSSFLCILKH